MSIESHGQPLLQLAEAGQAIALLGVDVGGNPVFEMHGGPAGKSVIVQLGETASGNGHLVLADKTGISRVEAGTLQNGDGAVRVYGPTGACTLAIAGIPCMIESK
jgi:hypothetical protein